VSRRITTRDYKRPTRRTLSADLKELKPYLLGALVGAALVFGGTLYMQQRNRPPSDEGARPEPRRTQPAAPHEANEAAAAETSERYDFYEMLPNFEVVVPEKDREVQRDVPATPVDRPGVYVLQAGSYRNESDAQRVRAQLALQGVDAKVQRVAVDNDVWHRVRIGPINSLDEVNRLRKRLQAGEIDALVIRVGD